VLYRVQKPSPPLQSFIENLWYHEGVTTDHAMDRLLPDGAIELIFDLTDRPKIWYDSETPGRVRTVGESWLSGQHRRSIVIESAKESCMIGARFRPGGLHPFLAMPVAEVNDAVEETELLWGRGTRELRERLLAADSVDERFRILDRALFERARGKLEPDVSLSYVLERLVKMPGETVIRSLAEDVGLTQKRLVRTFEEKVGLKPKTLSRVLRFQTVLRRIERKSRVSWSFVAQEAGYYDQSHFIRDFEAFSGLAPSQYLVDRGEFLNFVPLR
jgi:methylphosphotriester-DNA--protein-cysteine methyltransferase